MTIEEQELDRKFSCAISTLDTEINFLRQEKSSLQGEEDITFADMLENARNIFLAVHKEWRAHIGDPVMDKQKIIGGLIHELANMIEHGKLEF